MHHQTTEIEPSASGVRYWLLAVTIFLALALLGVTLRYARLDTDVVASLPRQDGVLTDAVEIFRNHPLQDQVALDIGLPTPDRERLVALGRQAQAFLAESGLFHRVGLDQFQNSLPALVTDIANHLPAYFTLDDLQNRVAPRLTTAAIESRLTDLYRGLSEMQAIGQYHLMRQDPLGLRNIPLGELAALAPSPKGHLYKGHLITRDGCHLLILAQPKTAGTDTAAARRLSALFSALDEALTQGQAARLPEPVLTPFGAFRAALDNETIVRRDVHKAILLATLGIAVLLILTFPRPWLGLLALLPALVGTVVALAMTALIFRSVSAMALGFGGAIISITVDHGIAYLLFLDRPQRTSGKGAAREVWAIGLLAAMTSMGAFVVLSFSGFPMFRQLGLFTALGIGFAFLFVHTVFPLIFPSMPAARRAHRPVLQKAVRRLINPGLAGLWTALLLTVALGSALLSGHRPHFNVELRAMNTVRPATRDAEALFKTVWGDVFDRVFVMLEADSLEALTTKSDRLCDMLRSAVQKGELRTGFKPARLFPGAQSRATNLADWRRFWTPQRISKLQQDLISIGHRLGFTESAFAPFIQNATQSSRMAPLPALPPADYFALLGIAAPPPSAANPRWRQYISLSTGPAYDSEAFYVRFSGLARVFDGTLYSNRMGSLLFTTFERLLTIIGGAVALLLLIFFRDWRLTLMALLPICFAVVCTLGTLGFLGRPLDIAALMLAIVVVGMGIDYALFLVRAFQRYGNAQDARLQLIALAVCMASASTLIGFGGIAMAEHALLQSAGLTSLLGIAFALLGAFLILPPLLARRARTATRVPQGK